MATRFLLVSLFLSLLVACDKKEDDINSGQEYTGQLTLNYSRTFPSFESEAVIPMNIAANGVVTFSDPQRVGYMGESQKMIHGERIRIREEGTISISSLMGEWTNVEGKECVMVNLSCLLNGIQTLWAYQDYQWLKVSETPYTLENPVECPMHFRVDNAVLSEAVCGSSCCDTWGNSCFRWRLVLTPSN